MIAGGGTGGHIYPAIAIARAWLARDAERRVVFVGTRRGLETTIVPKAGFPLEFLSVGGLKGKGPFDLMKNAFRLPIGIVQAWRLVGKHRPAAVVGVGGYASGPALLAAWLRGVPTMIHEQNAFPGVANRAAARFVTAVAVAFEEALARLGRKDGVVTGNPVREEFFRVTRRAGEGPNVRLLVFGGSQGSHLLNEAMTGALLFLAHLRETLEIVHQTGPRELESVRAAYRASAFAGARVAAWLDPMAEEMEAADFVVSRAGAMTIGELAAAGRGAILVPFAAAADNHQEVNARVVEAAGGAIVITEKELTPERLAKAVSEIAADRDRCRRMGEAARRLAAPGATSRIVDLIETISEK